MSRQYYNRYELFINEDSFNIVPGIEIPIKTTDKYLFFKRGKDRLDKISQQYYNTPVFGWLILQANPQAGGLEFEIPDNYVLRVPFPLVVSLQDYKRNVELYKLYYGEQ
jgi:hypothetical protein